MTTKIPFQKHNPIALVTHPWQYAERWLEMDPDTWQHIDQNARNHIRQSVATYAKTTLAAQIIQELQPTAQRLLSSDIQNLVKIIVTLSGSFTFGTGMGLLSANFGALAPIGGLLGGAIGSFTVAWLAVIAHSNFQQRQQAQKRLAAIAQCNRSETLDQEYPKPIKDHLYKAQRALVQKVEGNALQRSLPVCAVAALLLSAIEYAIALYIVQQATILSDILLPIRVLVAALPVILTHVIALGEAIAFERPRHASELQDAYRQELTPSVSSSNAEINHWQLCRGFEDGGLAAWIDILFDRHPNEPTPALGRTAFEQGFLSQGVSQLESQMQEQERLLWQNYQQLISKLPEQFSPFPKDRRGLTQWELDRMDQQTFEQRKQWIEQQIQVLEEQTERQIEQMRAEYKTSIDLWRNTQTQVQAAYERQRQQWEQRKAEWTMPSHPSDQGFNNAA